MAAKIPRLSRLDCQPSFWMEWSQEKVAKHTGIRQNRISQIISNTNFREIDNLFFQDRDMFLSHSIED
jgi:hypothetical protein